MSSTFQLNINDIAHFMYLKGIVSFLNLKLKSMVHGKPQRKKKLKIYNAISIFFFFLLSFLERHET